MPELVQIMRFRTSDHDALTRLTEQYRAETVGRATYTSEILGRDLDTGEYVVIVTFPSHAAAAANNDLPETQAMAERTAAMASEGPSFSNIEVLERR